MPFRQKRAKALIQVLLKDPNALYVSGTETESRKEVREGI
jgi:hypothetical protein